MDATPNRGYPYPQCEPPLVKDASDIAQVRDLAVAIDADVQAIYDRASDVVVRPDAARVSMTATLADTANALFPFFNSRTFDTTGTAMTPIADGVMRLVEPGWYGVGCWVHLISATFLGARARFLVDGSPATSFSTQAEIAAANGQHVHLAAEIFSPLGGQDLSLEVRIGAGSPSYTYVARMWADQEIRL